MEKMDTFLHMISMVMVEFTSRFSKSVLLWMIYEQNELSKGLDTTLMKNSLWSSE